MTTQSRLAPGVAAVAQPSPLPAAQALRPLDPRPQSPLSPATSRERVASRERLCPHCGGSGILRLDDQRFRTCLDCLGQGRIRLALRCDDVRCEEVPLSGPTSSAA